MLKRGSLEELAQVIMDFMKKKALHALVEKTPMNHAKTEIKSTIITIIKENLRYFEDFL